MSAATVPTQARRTVSLSQIEDRAIPGEVHRSVVVGPNPVEHPLGPHRRIEMGDHQAPAAGPGRRSPQIVRCQVESARLGISFRGRTLRDQQIDAGSERFECSAGSGVAGEGHAPPPGFHPIAQVGGRSVLEPADPDPGRSEVEVAVLEFLDPQGKARLQPAPHPPQTSDPVRGALRSDDAQGAVPRPAGPVTAGEEQRHEVRTMVRMQMGEEEIVQGARIDPCSHETSQRPPAQVEDQWMRGCEDHDARRRPIGLGNEGPRAQGAHAHHRPPRRRTVTTVPRPIPSAPARARSRRANSRVPALPQ